MSGQRSPWVHASVNRFQHERQGVESTDRWARATDRGVIPLGGGQAPWISGAGPVSKPMSDPYSPQHPAPRRTTCESERLPFRATMTADAVKAGCLEVINCLVLHRSVELATPVTALMAHADRGMTFTAPQIPRCGASRQAARWARPIHDQGGSSQHRQNPPQRGEDDGQQTRSRSGVVDDAMTACFARRYQRTSRWTGSGLPFTRRPTNIEVNGDNSEGIHL